MTSIELNALRAHLGKELRDQRGTMLRLALIVVAATVAAALALPESMVGHGELTLPMLVLGALVGAIAVAIDLVPSEGERGTIALLTRLPGGLRLAFVSKAATVLVSLASFAALGIACTYLCWLARFPAAGPGIKLWLWWWPDSVSLLLATALGLGWWVLAIASWMPRGLPALFVPLLFAAPHLVVRGLLAPLGDDVAAEKWLLSGDAGWILCTQAPLALLVARASLVRGRRWSGGPRASARVGCAAALLALLPAWGTLGYRAWLWLTPPVGATALPGGWTGSNGRYSFQTLQRDEGWPHHAFATETATGKTLRLGGASSWVEDWSQGYRGVFPRSQASTDYVVLGAAGSPAALLDASTLEVVRPLPDLSLDAELTARFRASLRAHDRVRLPDGRRAFVLDGKMEIEAGDGSVETVALPNGCWVHAAAGTGLTLSTRGGVLVYDFVRRRLVGERPQETPWIHCLGQHWLVPVRTKGGYDTDRRELLDPDSGERTALPAELAAAEVVTAFADGRVLLATKLAPPGRGCGKLLLATLPGGPSAELGLPEGFERQPDPRSGWSLRCASCDGNVLPESGELVLRLAWSGGAGHVTSYRLGDTRLGPAWPAERVVARVDRDTVLVPARDGTRLERLCLSTGERTPLTTEARR